MHIQALRIRNFRQLKNARIDLERDISIFVGANNSGKTSAAHAIGLFLGDETDGLSVHDLSVHTWAQMNVPRRQGDLAAVWATARELGVPAVFLNLVDCAARRMPWPLAVLLPLAYVSKANGTATEVAHDVPCETWRGLPLFALDQFTRRGRMAIGRWFAGCRELQQILQAAAPRPAWPKIIRYAVFAVEGQVCSRHLMWPEQRDVLRRSMLAELAGRGLPAEYMDPLLACATANLAALNERRREVMDEAPI